MSYSLGMDSRSSFWWRFKLFCVNSEIQTAVFGEEENDKIRKSKYICKVCIMNVWISSSTSKCEGRSRVESVEGICKVWRKPTIEHSKSLVYMFYRRPLALMHSQLPNTVLVSQLKHWARRRYLGRLPIKKKLRCSVVMRFEAVASNDGKLH